LQDCSVGQPTMSNRRLPQGTSDEPAALYRIVEATIGQELKARYEVPNKVPHQLLVLLIQMHEQRRAKRRGKD
jgi:hypothetical protein